jgi:DNA-binding MurR/RpiR family transcriptional regulator
VNIRNDLSQIPDALRQMCDEGLPLYDALVRRGGWSERPLFMLGAGPSYPAALTGAWAFQSLLGMPVVVEKPGAFNAYTFRALTPRSLVIVIAGPHHDEEILAAARKARSQGAVVLAITPDPASELAALANAAVTDYSVNADDEGSRSVFCRHAAMLFLAVAAARVLKAPAKSPNAQQDDLTKLAGHVDWVLNQVSDAARALAKQMSALPGLYLTGGGAFYPVALQASKSLRRLGNVSALGVELLDFEQSLREITQPGSGIVYLSSSRCGLRQQVHRSVRNVRQDAARKIFAITDGNDRQLSDRADMAILLPILTEAGAALLSLVFLELASSYVGPPARRPPGAL